MKNLKKIFLGLCLTSAIFSGLTSCGSDSTAVPAVQQLPGSKGTITATVNGQTFGSNLTQSTRNSSIISIAGNATSSTGATGNTKNINLSFSQLKQTGTYQLNNQSFASGIIASYSELSATTGGITSADTYSATSGSVTITELSSTKIKGTFNFSAENSSGKTVTITNGVFDISF